MVFSSAVFLFVFLPVVLLGALLQREHESGDEAGVDTHAASPDRPATPRYTEPQRGPTRAQV